MGIVTTHHYRDGKRAPDLPFGDLHELCADGDLIWIELDDPTDDELSDVQNAFHLHPLAIEDSLQTQQLPKLEVFEDQIFIVAHTAALVDDNIIYGQLSIFIGEHHIVTVRQGPLDARYDLHARVERMSGFLKHGVDAVLHTILDVIVDAYQPVVEQIEDEILCMEEKALRERLIHHEVFRMFKLKRELMRFQRDIGPMAEIVSSLARVDLPCIAQEARPYYRDVWDHARRTDAMVTTLREVITSVFEISSLLEEQRQGDISRRLSAWAGIIAVPTAVAGIYGMNFDYMPELHWQYGYFTVIGAILAMCSLLYVLFKRERWL